MVLFRNEQLPNETLRPGDRIKVLVTDIRHNVRGLSIMLSRTHPALIRRLFELEIPEIADGTVEIKSLAREAGSRTKIAVLSHDDAVDPVGACIGPKGGRKNAVAAELCGEKIDIIPYKDDPPNTSALRWRRQRCCRSKSCRTATAATALSSATTSFRSPSAAKDRTRDWPPS